MEIKELTKKLITIPSYVDSSTNEKAIADFIFAYLKKRTNLIVRKEKIVGERYNIIAFSPQCQKSENSLDVDTLFIDHIDTVEPKTGWGFDQFAGIENEEKLYGLGAADTKGNVAILMKLAELVTNQKYMFLFYVDEEYHFQGIKTFIDDYKNCLQIKNIISADGENLHVRNACRGLIELDIVCTGKTGHSANPENGVNTIRAFSHVIRQLEKILSQKTDEDFGRTTMNTAYIRGGLNRGENRKTVTLGRSGNNIPDYLEATFEFRTNSSTDLELIQNTLENLCKREKITVSIIQITHNLKPWYTKKEKLTSITQALKSNDIPIMYTDAGKSGYVDIALLYEAFQAVCYCIGVSGSNRHGVNEYLEIDSLYKLFEIFKMMYNKN